MENRHHTSLIKQLLRALLGVFLSVGFGALWLGIFKGNSDLIIFGAFSCSLGIFHIVLSFSTLKRWRYASNRSQSYRSRQKGKKY